MPRYAYRAVSARGKTLEGVQESLSASSLESELANRGMLLLHLAPELDNATREVQALTLRGRRSEVTRALRFLSDLLDAGFPLDQALATAVRSCARSDVTQALESVRTEVRSGSTLADALAGHPALFPAIAVGMTRAGEYGSYLAESLAQLANRLERTEALRSSLISSLLYPAAMFVVGAASLAVLLVYVLPRFADLLSDAGVAMPGSTAALMNGASFLSDAWPLLAVLATGAVAAVAVWRRTPSGRTSTDRLLLRFPITGWVRRRSAAAPLAGTLAALLQGGVPLVKALEVAADSCSDSAVALDLRQAAIDVRGGDQLTVALGRSRALPPVFIEMLAVGEASGRIPDLLERSGALLERELTEGLKRAVGLAEPILIVLFAAAVGFVALALLRAVYSINAGGF